MKVQIVHVPYVHRGGEDVHVDSLVQAYEELGFEVRVFPKRPVSYQSGDVLASLGVGKRSAEFSKAFSEFQADIVHLHNIFPVLGAEFLEEVQTFKGKKVLMTVHNHRFFCTNGLALQEGKICKDCFSSPSVLRPVVRNCNSDLSKSVYYSMALQKIRKNNLLKKAVHQFIAPSPYIQNELIRFGFSEGSVVHLINPVKFSESGSEGDLPGPRVKTDIFYAGRLSQEKGIGNFLEVIKEMPDLRFTIAGGGPLEGKVRSTAEKFKNLSYLGSLPREEIRKQILGCRATVLPSVCNEILPTFALESFVCGKRCVVPDLDSTRWLSEEPFGGVLANTSDLQALKASVAKALGQETLSEEDRTKVAQRLSFDEFKKGLKEICYS